MIKIVFFCNDVRLNLGAGAVVNSKYVKLGWVTIWVVALLPSLQASADNLPALSRTVDPISAVAPQQGSLGEVQKTELGSSINKLAQVASVFATVGLGTTPNITPYTGGSAQTDFNNPSNPNSMLSGLPIGFGSTYKLGSNMEMGASFTQMISSVVLDSTAYAIKQQQRLQLILAHLDVHPFKTSRAFYAGAMAGVSIYRGVVGTSSDSGEPVAYFVGGTRVGLDFDLMDHFTLGPELRAVISSGGIQKSFFSSNAVIRYWF